MANIVQGALDARQAGFSEQQGITEQLTRRRAGQQMARGNLPGASAELYGAGMIDAGLGIDRVGQQREDRARDESDREAQGRMAAQKQQLEFLTRGAQVLQQIPAEKRQQAYMEAIAPTLKAMGADDQTIQTGAQHLDDASLQTFLGEISKAAEEYTLAPGSKRFRGSELIAEAPFAPEYRSVGPGDTLVQVGAGGGGASGGSDFASQIGPMLEREGGFVASDGASGAPANFGINQRANPDVDVRNLTRDQASRLYKERYWDAVGADQLPPQARGAVFDAAVNQGVDAAKQMWQQSGGDLGRFNELRLQRYRQTPGYERYGKSWERRVAETGGGGGDGARVIAQGQPKPTNEAANRKEFQTLRKEWNGLDEVKAFKDVSQSYKQVRALAKPGASAADDIALTFSFMKMLDPGSVVREGEYALVGRAAGLPDQIIMGLQRVDSGKGLTPAIRNKLVEAAAKIMIQRREALDNIAGSYRQLAQDMGANPDLLVDAPGSWRARVTPERTNRIPLDKIFGN